LNRCIIIIIIIRLFLYSAKNTRRSKCTSSTVTH